MKISRRDLCALGPVAAMLAAWPLSAQTFPANKTSIENAPDGPLLANSAVYPFDKLPVHTSASGMESRPVLRGHLPTGELLEVHETLLPAGAMPHPPHHHTHSELWLVREGTVALTVHGVTQTVGPGGVGFAASNQQHSIRNVGPGPAQYFVVAVGPGAA
jgi:mannose-6-phosphate isomerase-like protein (cupin superfamily)